MPLPDREAVMAQVKTLAEEARDNPPAPGYAGPATHGPVPIHMGSTTKLFIPEHYVIDYTVITCANCGRISRDQQFFALTYIKSRTGMGARVRNLQPVRVPEFNLPVERRCRGHESIPYCSECETIDLSHLPPPPEAASLHDLPDAAPRGGRHSARGTETSKQPKGERPPRGASLDDLI